MNPLFVVPLLAYTLAATLWPGQVDGRRRGRALLFGEALFVIAALVLGTLLAPLARPSLTGLWWGRVALLATAYLYVSGRGIVLVRRVLELPTLPVRRDRAPPPGAADFPPHARPCHGVNRRCPLPPASRSEPGGRTRTDSQSPGRGRRRRESAVRRPRGSCVPAGLPPGWRRRAGA